MEKTGGSRLLQMQARFQQKQMQEREMKIASLYEAQQARALDRVRHSPSNVGSAASPPHRDTPVAVSHQPGKVRQMFEERRTKAGIDKSYPLQPIHNTDKATARKPLPNGYSKVTTGAKLSVERKTNKTHISSTTNSIKRQQHKIENIVNGSGDLNHNHEPDLHPVKQKLPQSNGELIHPSNIDEVDRAANNYLIENETFPDALAPTPTPRSPDPPVEAKKPLPRRGPVKRISPAKTQPPPIVAPATPRGAHNEHSIASENSKARGAMQKTPQSVLSKKLSVTASNNGGVESARSSRSRVAGSAGSGSGPGAGGAVGEPCAICGRRFAADRLDKHQDICKKSHAKKRKPFDVLKHRLAGTEAEPFINKLRKSVNTPSSTKIKPLNSSWRKKHEEFINAIRAAKQVQAHLDAGGKLSDLPPPPPSENPDYVSCPHCGRRFNQGAAERHIPKCANYQFNKPKNGSKRR